MPDGPAYLPTCHLFYPPYLGRALVEKLIKMRVDSKQHAAMMEQKKRGTAVQVVLQGHAVTSKHLKYLIPAGEKTRGGPVCMPAGSRLGGEGGRQASISSTSFPRGENKREGAPRARWAEIKGGCSAGSVVAQRHNDVDTHIYAFHVAWCHHHHHHEKDSPPALHYPPPPQQCTRA